MANRLITPAEAVAGILEELRKLSPKEQAWALYSMQTGMGGFPRDPSIEAEIAALPD